MSNSGQERLEELARQADALAGQSLSDATMKAYRSDWARFEDWCYQNDLIAMPADPRTIGLWIVELAKWASPSTIARRLAAVSFHHRQRYLNDPTKDSWVRQVHSGVRRMRGTRPNKQAPALTIEQLRAMVAAVPHDLRGVRDKAVLLTAWWSALRSSEVVGLLAEDVTAAINGLVVLVRRAKTDQLGRGRHIALPRVMDDAVCPVLALEEWRAAGAIDSGALFPTMDRWSNVGTAPMSTRAVHRLITRTARRAELTDWELFSPHSTRSGFITAASSVASEAEVAAQSGHADVAVLRGYIRSADVFDHNAVSRLAAHVAEAADVPAVAAE